jgi:putative FmdB family regulatory protein
MPIYEWNCAACALSFEGLAPVEEADQPRACPACGQPAGRIISACAIISAAPSMASVARPAMPDAHMHGHNGHRPPIPEPARLCWMDDKSAERFAAYKMGCGHEYDDKQAARAELSQRRGDPPAPPPATSTSPVAAGLARRKAKEAAQTAPAPQVVTPSAS